MHKPNGPTIPFLIASSSINKTFPNKMSSFSKIRFQQNQIFKTKIENVLKLQKTYQPKRKALFPTLNSENPQNMKIQKVVNNCKYLQKIEVSVPLFLSWFQIKETFKKKINSEEGIYSSDILKEGVVYSKHYSLAVSGRSRHLMTP